MKVKYKLFKPTLGEMFTSFKGSTQFIDDAAEFASGIEPDNLINISILQGGVVVWYWG